MEIISLKQACSTLRRNTYCLKSTMKSFIRETADWLPHVTISSFLMCSCIVESRFCTIPPLVSRESSLSWVDYRVSCSKPLQSRSSSTSLPTWRAIPKEATGSCSPPPCLFPFSSRSFCPFSGSSSHFFLLGSSSVRLAPVWRYVASKLLRACPTLDQPLQEGTRGRTDA